MKTLVTGGSRGIGLATALRLAQAGHQTWIAARGEEQLQAACRSAADLSLTPLVMDVADPASVATGFGQLGPGLDVLVHAAGTGAYSDLLDPEDPAIWQQVIATNLGGAYHCARAAAALMPAGSRIIFIASVLGLRGMRHSHAYCASKHGVIGLMRALAQDLMPRGITVNAICPGWVETAMARQDLAAMASRYALDPQELEAAEIAAVPLNRWIQPQEVAELVAYLASPAAAAVTGQALEISGGL
ncbi:MAG TPA: SDR family oxidoreductase [Candidatus Obscuribacterales bacterium]